MYEKVIEDAINFDTIYDNISKKIIGSTNKDESEVNKDILAYLQDICYKELKSGKVSGILENSGYMQELIKRHNSKFILSKRNKDCFSTLEITQYRNPFKLKTVRDEFDTSTLDDTSVLEMYAKAMHWSNKLAKYFDSFIEGDFKKRKDYRYFSEFVYTKLIKEDLDTFYLSYPDFKDMTDEEIKEEYGEEEYEEYVAQRKKVLEVLKENVPGMNEFTLDNYMTYSYIAKASAKAYSMKSKMLQRTIVQACKEEQTKGKKFMHYVTIDKEREGKNEDFKYVYGIALQGMTEPYEVHATEESITGCLALAEIETGHEAVIPIANSVEYFKTSVPRKLSKELKTQADWLTSIDCERNKLAYSIATQFDDVVWHMQKRNK